MLTLYGLGTILGAGIYVLVGKVAIHAGIYAPISFLFAALLAGLSGYSYAALSAHLPKSAGEAVYIETAFHFRPLSILVGWMVVLTGIVSAATIANGFVGYLQVFVPITDFWAITLLILAMTGLAYWGVNESVWVTAATTILGIIGLLIILAYSVPAFTTLPERLPDLTPPSSDGNIWFGILLGAFLAFYAFIGFEDMVNMAEEVKQPEITLPKAIIAAIIISSVFYYLIALAAVLQLPQAELIASKAPMADILKQHNEDMAWFVSLISLAAIVNGALVQIIMGARVLYGMGKHQMAPLWLAAIHPVRKTPYIATLLIGLIVWLFASQFHLATLASITSFIIIMVFLLVNIALIKLIYSPASKDKFTAKPWVPITGVLMSLMFLGVQVYQLISGAIVIGH
ncbi:amino acid permease [Oceaniserpentilla sp. 4NH20-0058]